MSVGRPRTVLLLACLVVLTACAEPSGGSEAAEWTPSSSATTSSSSVTPGNGSVAGEVSCSISGDQPFPVAYLEGPDLSPDEFSATALGAGFAAFFENGPGAPEGGMYREATGFSIVSDSLVLGYQGQLPSARFIVEDGTVRRWGGCLPNRVSDGLVAAQWQLAAPVAADTTTLEIAVEGGACVTKAGNDIVTEVAGSDVVEDTDAVTVTVWTRDEPVQGACAGVGIMLRSSVELPSPLNGRTLLNGGPVPPQKVRLTPIQLEPPEDDDSSLGRLHCAPSTVGEQLVADIGQDPQDIIKSAVPSVVEVESGQPLWWWGIDKDGEVVAALALGDMDAADYQLWTCQD